MEPVTKDPIYASLNYVARSEAAKAFVSTIRAEVIEWERKHGKLKKRRAAKDAASFEKAIEGFIADLLRAHSQGRVGAYHSMQRESFTGGSVGWRVFEAVLEALIGLGLVSHTPGRRRFRAHFGVSEQEPGKASVFAATPKLLKRAEEAFGNQQAFTVHFIPELPTHPLCLNKRSQRHGGKKERGRPHRFDRSAPEAQRLEQQVRDINEFLAGFAIEGANHYGFNRVFSCGDDEDFDWNKGGRLYSVGDDDNYQRMPPSRKDDRPGRDEITIDGEAVAEIDIRSCNLTIFYALMGERLDLSNDPFTDLGIDRDLAKRWVNASFGLGKLLVKWPKKLSEEYEKKKGVRPAQICTAKAVKELVLKKLPDLKRLNEAGSPDWSELQYLESESIINTMTMLMEEGIPSLAVHDSLIIPRQHSEKAKAFLIESFKKRVGVAPIVTAKD